MRGLQLAEEQLGLDQLAARLDVPPGAIDDWRMGLAAMPTETFVELVGLLSGIDPSWRDTSADAMRIVVIDDNVDAAVTLAHLLGMLGHEATAVVDSRQALSVAREVQPDMAIIDLNMPYVNGIEMARLFRQDGALKQVSLVALTAMDGADYREMTRQAGFDAHLRKPADSALLRAIIAQFAPG